MIVAVVIATGISILFKPDDFQEEASTAADLPITTNANIAIKRSQDPFTPGPDQPDAAETIQPIAFTQITPKTAYTLTVTQKPVDWLWLLYPELVRIAELENQPADMARAELLPMLDNDDPVIRLAAVESLGDMSTEATTEALLMALNDSNSLVRIAALEALSDKDHAIANGSIETLLYDPLREVRLAAIDALADLEQESAAFSLAGLLGDPDVQIRHQSVYALGEIGGNYSIPYLLQARYDSHSKIRVSANAILREMGVTETD